MRSALLRALLALGPQPLRARAAEILEVHQARRAARSGLINLLWFDVREVAGLLWVIVVSRVGGWLGSTRVRGEHEREGVGMIDRAWQDLSFAAKTLLRNPGFTLSAVAILALGTGGSTAIFSAANAFFLRPLPFADPGRLVVIYETNPDFGWVHATAAPANLLDWREQVDAFEDVSGYSDFVDEVTSFVEGEPVVLRGAGVMGDFFTTLGARPEIGRTFGFEETWAGASPVVVISHDLWVRRFGGDPGVVGQRLELSEAAPEIIGVMPAGFRFPNSAADLWTPTGWDPEAREQPWFQRAHFVRAIARLAPGVTQAEAAAQLAVVVDRLQSTYPGTNDKMGAGLTPLRRFLTGDIRTPLLVLLGAVALLLLVASANVAGLMLVRVQGRVRELALRHALGAERMRVARQLLTESLLVGVGGAGLGLALGWAGVRSLARLRSVGIDGATSLALDHRVVLFALGAGLLSGAALGLAPALAVFSGDIDGALRSGDRSHTSRRANHRTVGFLVAGEVALALVLVSAAALMLRSAWSLRQVDPGVRTDGVVAVQFSVPADRYATRGDVLAFYDRFEEMLEARTGVTRVGTVGWLPLAGTSWSSQFQAEGWPPERIGLEILHRRADTGYFEAVGTPLVRGRMFGPDDGPGSKLVVVINETFAKEHFPGEDPLGKRIAYDRAASEESTWYEIVGIVGDQHQVSPRVTPRAEVFENRDQDWGRENWVVVRGEGSGPELISAVQSALRELDPNIPLASARTLEGVWAESMARESFVLVLLGIFGAVALLLASVGVYGVTAQAARRRTREVGIRVALGAGGAQVVRLMVGQGMSLVLLGLLVGTAGAVWATRALASFLYGVQPGDPLTLAAAAVLLGSVALIASWLPARSATRVDPVASLRAE